jgi:hypothetical protein
MNTLKCACGHYPVKQGAANVDGPLLMTDFALPTADLTRRREPVIARQFPSL